MSDQNSNLDKALDAIKRHGETAEVRRQMTPPREEISHHQKQVERSGYSDWSAPSFGGGVWGGRSNH